jgi:antibiotic biosynthesis monooxygenase (ABM) superfamily enzyme
LDSRLLDNFSKWLIWIIIIHINVQSEIELQEIDDIPSGIIDINGKKHQDIVLQMFVPISEVKYYEDTWLHEIIVKVKKYTGFQKRHVFKVSTSDIFVEYVIVLTFDTYDNFYEWKNSKERIKCFDKLKKRHNGYKTQRINNFGGDIHDDSSVNRKESVAQIKVLPPPKWKLACIITFAVYSTLAMIQFCKSTKILLDLQLPIGFVTFLVNVHVVIMLVYSYLPLIMSLPFVDKWLRNRRMPIEEMSSIHAILDQGFLMFQLRFFLFQVTEEYQDKQKTIEKRLDILLDINHNLKLEVQSLKGCNNLSSVNTNNDKTKYDVNKDVYSNSIEVLQKTKNELHKNSDSLQTTGPMTMTVRHFIKWECTLDFENWTQEIDAEMSKFKGFGGLVTIAPTRDGEPHINSFTYESFEDLMEFSKSKPRENLLKRLKPMLEADSEYQMEVERSFNDAFTELFTDSSGKANNRPPPLWKSVILTILPLYIIVFYIGYEVSLFLVSLGFNVYVSIFITTLINVWLNSYIGVPFVQSHFMLWLLAPRAVNNDTEWIYLDIGLPFKYQLIFLILYVAIQVLCWYYY